MQDNEPEENEIMNDPMPMKRISNEEWFAISHALEEHHTVFYKLWQMGRPCFTKEIPTAAVQFDENGEFVWFHFNPNFWDSLNFNNKLFVICHEALHIILNHGLRTKEAGKKNRAAINVAMDIVVNHALVNKFGFIRNQIQNGETYCWVDRVFPDKNLPNDELFEFYYNQFERTYGDGNPGDGDHGDPDGQGVPGMRTVDSHEGLDGQGGDKVIDKLNESLTNQEKESLKSTIDKHFQKSEKNAKAGTGTGGQWVFANSATVIKRKWETVIKKWAKKYIVDKSKDVEQWARLNRRLTCVSKDMFIPSEMEFEDEDAEKTKINVWFYLDTSGSCWDLKDRFFTAALSLPKDKFDIRLFCFDTKVQETTLESKKVYGGGGTSFDILEKEIQMEMNSKGMPYPEAVFVITDGYGDNIKPEFPEKWYWFLTAGGTKSHISKECKFFSLEDYE